MAKLGRVVANPRHIAPRTSTTGGGGLGRAREYARYLGESFISFVSLYGRYLGSTLGGVGVGSGGLVHSDFSREGEGVSVGRV